MHLQRLWQWLDRSATFSQAKRDQRLRARLMVEPLEDRAVPASFTAATVADLMAHINAANLSAEADTITLAPGRIFSLKSALPVIATSGGSLTIIGNGDIIERSTAKNTPGFRLFTVVPGASLTLENLTLQGGVADNGGAIHNLGTLIMHGVTVQKNIARYGAAGGGIYSDGALTLQNCLIRNNQALGYDGTPAGRGSDHDGGLDYGPGGDGGWAFGGGVYVAVGTASLFGTTVTGNTAKGGRGGAGKYGQPAGNNGSSLGGGLYIASAAVVTLDSFTASHVVQNTADNTFYADIFGTFTISS